MDKLIEKFFDAIAKRIVEKVIERIEVNDVPARLDEAIDRYIDKHITADEILSEVNDLGKYIKNLKNKL